MPELPAADASVAVRPWDVVDESIELAERWWSRSRSDGDGEAGGIAAAALADPDGIEFTRRFVDGVIRPDDAFVSALALKRLAQEAPAFLSPGLRAALHVGSVTSLALPWAVHPIAKRLLRSTIGRLLLDAPVGPPTGRDAFSRAVGRVRDEGFEPVVNLLGESVLGEAEAARRRDALLHVLEREEVTEVSLKLSSIGSNLTMWGFSEAESRLSARLAPVFERAAERAAAGRPATVTLDMEEYRDLDLTISVFTRMLDEERFLGVPAGIVLQAYLPDSVGALEGLTRWAGERVERGGAPIRVRLVKGANLAMERVEAVLRGWQPAPLPDRAATDANLLRLLDLALRPERTRAVRVAVGSHNLYDLALAVELASRREVADALSVEMLLGMAPSAARAVRETVGAVRLYTPVVVSGEFTSAVAYLIRRFDELASAGGFLALSAAADPTPEVVGPERERLRAAAEAVRDAPTPEPRRRQDRTREWEPGRGGDALRRRPAPAEEEETAGGLTAAVLGLARGSSGDVPALAPAALPDAIPVVSETGFVSEPDTDPSLSPNRTWAARVIARAAAEPAPAAETLDAAAIGDADALTALIASVRAAGGAWGAGSSSARAAVVRRAALSLAANRDRLVEAMIAETGKTIAEADAEVSEAIDLARYYADRASELDAVDGARFRPVALTVVASPWNFPVAIPAGGVLAALASGSGVILKPAPEARHCAAVLVDTLWEAGIGRDLLALADLRDEEGAPAEGELGRALVTAPEVDRVLLTGAFETARDFLRWRPEMQLLAETSGKNAIIVTPSADIDLAVADIVSSAFGNAGQKCSAASTVILVGSMARSERFRSQLLDAVRSLRVGSPFEGDTQVGPLIRPPQGTLLHGLTALGPGERWLLEPRQVDGNERLWTPGIRIGVRGGSFAHVTELFGPVLSVMTAGSLTDAIELQNTVEFGLTAGLHSLDAEEIGVWLDNVQAGNLYVNRTITGAKVERQPFGGWKRSSVGAGAKTGGPNFLWALGDWEAREGTASSTLHLRGLAPRVQQFIEAAQPSLAYEDFDVLRRSALGDAFVWGTEFGVVRDVSRLGIERNLLRYWPVPVLIRAGEGQPLPDLLRTLAAGILAKAPLRISTATPVPAAIAALLGEYGAQVAVESDDAWLERVAAMTERFAAAEPTPVADALEPRRIRLLGDRVPTALALGGAPDVSLWAQPVTRAGRLELLAFLREQSISITAHRYGTPTDLTDGLF